MSAKGTRKSSTKKVAKTEKLVDDEFDIMANNVENMDKTKPEQNPLAESDEKSDDGVPEKEIDQPKPINFDDIFGQKSEPKKEDKKSITDFDYNDIMKIDVGDVKKLTSDDLLKILIVRGKEGKNSSLWSGALRLLKQINCEFDPLEQRGRPPFQQRSYDHQQGDSFNNGGYRGGYRGRGRGGYQPRGGYMPRDRQTRDEGSYAPRSYDRQGEHTQGFAHRDGGYAKQDDQEF